MHWQEAVRVFTLALEARPVKSGHGNFVCDLTQEASFQISPRVTEKLYYLQELRQASESNQL